MPADEEYFEIDANTRTISIPTLFKKYGVGVDGDHLAEMLVFKIDRYFDYQDLYNTKIAINWNVKLNGSREYYYKETRSEKAFAPNDVLEPEYVVFGFPITSEMAIGRGVLDFSVSFYSEAPSELAGEGQLLDYALNTLVVSVNINAGLSLEDPTKVNDSSAALRRRIQNSSYVPDGVSIPSMPEWRTGDVDRTTNKLGGLFYYADFPMNEDGSEPETLRLQAQAYSAGHIGAMNYTWFNSALQGDARDDNPAAMGILDTVAKLETAPADENELLSQANQNAIVVEQDKNEIKVYGNLAALNEFTSTAPGQGNAKWIGLDIGTKLDTIIGAKWNGYELSQADVDESASVGLAQNHIIFWAKANALVENEAIIVLSAEGYEDVPLKVKFVDSSAVTAPSDFIFAFEKTADSIFEENHIYYAENIDGTIDTVNRIDSTAKLNEVPNGTNLYELGSAFFATGAGLYKVKAQASKMVVQSNKPITVNSPVLDSLTCQISAAVEPEVVLSVTKDLSNDFTENSTTHKLQNKYSETVIKDGEEYTVEHEVTIEDSVVYTVDN